MIALNEEVEIRKLDNEWQESYKGLFGLLKTNLSEDENQTGNWFNRITLVIKCSTWSSLVTSPQEVNSLALENL